MRYGPPATPQVTRYLYDALSRLVKITYPDNQIVEYAYNAEGQLIEVTDMLGQKTEVDYRHLVVTHTRGGEREIPLDEWKKSCLAVQTVSK